MKMYATTRHSTEITIVEVERKTEQSVWINGRRAALRSSWNCFFDTFDEAKEHLLEVAENRLSSARRSLEIAQGFMGNVKGLKE